MIAVTKIKIRKSSGIGEKFHRDHFYDKMCSLSVFHPVGDKAWNQ
jgi:hypothetical protein